MTSNFARSLYATTASPLALGIALAMATPAYAQDAAEQADPATAEAVKAAEAQPGEEIVVTGIRASIRSAAAQKRANTSIVEVIAAEDIGKLPDQSIAESLSRLPGLATQRLDGRANVVSIRGLAPDFTTTLLNGREQVSANNNRGVELDQYPSELLNGAVVYKTPNAGLIGQALGGTIDMKTVRPLTFKNRQFNVGARAEINDLGKLNPDISNKGYRFNLSYIDQNDAGTVGWALGYARMQSPTQEERWNAWGYPNIDSDTQVIGGAKPYVKSNKLKRDGLMGVLEFQPTDAAHITLDGYWSKFNDDQRLRGIELPLQWSAAQLQPGYTEEDGLVTSGQFNGVEAVMRNDVVHRTSKIFAVGANAEFDVNDRLTVMGDASYSRLRKVEENLEIYLGTGRGGGVGATDNLGFEMPASGGVVTFNPTIDYADPNLFVITDPQGWNNCGGTLPNCQDGFVNRPRIKDRLQSLRLQATQEVGSGNNNVTVGANYSDRRKQLIDEGFVLTHINHPASTPVPADYLFDPVSLDFIGIPGMVAFDSWKYYNDGNYDLTDEGIWEPGRARNSYIVNEKVLTGYGQFNIDMDQLRGNVGVQIVHTDQSADGSVVEDNGDTVTIEPVTDGDTYTDILPSLNLSYEFAPQTYVRFGASRMLARARMDQLNPGGGFSFNQALNIPGATTQNSPWSGTVGNARLKPLKANTVDLAVEKYFGQGGYVTAGVFYKKILTWVYRQNDEFDFTGYPTPGNVAPVINTGIVSQWKNGGGGKVYGAEASLSLPFKAFSEALDGFGVLASGSYTKSRVIEAPGSQPIQMPGLSRWVLNGTAYFEKHGFQARVSGRYRAKFLAEVSGLSLVRDRINARSEFIVDAQVGYTFQTGPLRNLGILFTGSNLTNEPFITYYNNDIRQVRDYQNYGRNFMAGVSYKF